MKRLASLLVLAVLLAATAWLAWWFLFATAVAPASIATPKGAADPGRTGAVAPSPQELGQRDLLPPALLDEVPQEARREAAIESFELRVRVVDANHRPLAAIPVALGFVGSHRTTPLAEAVSAAPDGIVRFSYDERDFARRSPNSGFALYFPFPEAHATVVPVDPRRPPQEPIEMVAPPFGRVAITLEDDAGLPVRDGGELSLIFSIPSVAGVDPRTPSASGFADTSYELVAADSTATRTSHQLRLDAAGRALLEPVGLGLEMVWQASIREFADVDVSGPGPTRAGETVEFRLHLPARGPVVVGTLVEETGAPVALRRLVAWISRSADLTHDGLQSDAPLTDAQGRFRVDLSKRDWSSPPAQCWLHVELRSEEERVVGAASVLFDSPHGPGEIDAGTLRLATAATLVTGQVVDEKGAPIVTRLLLLPADALMDGPSWRADRQRGEGTTDATGRFAITGFAPAEPHVVVALVGPDRVGRSPAILPGATDVRIVVHGTGSIDGSLITDPSVPSWTIALFLRSRDDDAHSDGDAAGLGWRIAPSADGKFWWRGVPAGSVDVVVALGRYTTMPQIVAVIEGVEVRAGGTSTDPRLAAIDLRGRLPRFEVEVVDPEGHPLEHGSITLLAPDSHERVFTTMIEKGSAKVPTTRPTLDLEVRASGFRSQRLFGAVPPVRVQMRPGPEVVVVFAPPPQLGDLREQFELRASLEVDLEPGFRSPAVAQAPIDELGEAHLRTSEPGRHRLAVIARWQAPPSERGTQDWREKLRAMNELLARDPVTVAVDVADSDAQQRIVLPVPPETRSLLAQALRIARGG